MGILSGLMGNAGVVEPEKLHDKYGKLLSESETIEIGFVLVRDEFIFTNCRLILIDKQGMTGRKMSTLSVPYNKITKYSIETAGHFDLDAELRIWVGSEPEPIAKQFNRKVSIYDVQQVLARHVLG